MITFVNILLLYIDYYYVFYIFQSARKKKGFIQGKPVVVKGKKPKATNTY